MKIAALYDIHGNLPALEAVLEEFEDVRPDIVIVGGDIVTGPMPAQTLELLRRLGERALFIRGNADREVVEAFDNQPSAQRLPAEVRQITEWTAHQLSQEQRDFLAGLPEHLMISVEILGDVLFCHATPRSDEEIFTPRTSPERLQSIFQEVEQQVIVCGHTHVQFEILAGSARILNAGSVGMPYADQPGAYWLLLEPGKHEFRRAVYNLEAAAQTVRATGYPQAQQFANENILTIPTAEEAIAVFSSRG